MYTRVTALTLLGALSLNISGGNGPSRIPDTPRPYGNRAVYSNHHRPDHVDHDASNSDIAEAYSDKKSESLSALDLERTPKTKYNQIRRLKKKIKIQESKGISWRVFELTQRLAQRRTEFRRLEEN
jgi:DNA-binding CsgD family transcriptional regulator